MRTILLAICFVISTQGVAAAHWQYTRWGMSPGQVIEASKTIAHLASDPTRNSTTSARNLIDAKYSTNGMNFDVHFLFDEKNKLSHVNLELEKAINCPSLQGKLSNAYGPPEVSSTSLTRVAKWWDKRNGNVLVLLQIGDQSCSLQYSEHKEAGATGGL